VAQDYRRRIMQARFPGTCRDCGNKFPAGTDIHYDRRTKKASCCNGSPQVARADRAFIVDGAMKMEWVEEKTFQEIVDFMADSPVYEERVYSGYNWMCVECRLVWDKQHQAKGCGKRDHAASYEDTYGVKEVRNGVPTGPNMYTITRTAIRREKSLHNPGCDGSGSHANGCTFGDYESTSSHQPGCDGSGSHKDGCTNGPVPQVEEPAQVTGFDPKLEADKPWSQIVKEREIRACRVCTSMIANHRAYGRPPQPYDSTLCECCEEKPAPQADPQDEGCCAGCECGNECLPDCPTQAKQDMTSEEMWESMPSVTQPTITTTWN